MCLKISVEDRNEHELKSIITKIYKFIAFFLLRLDFIIRVKYNSRRTLNIKNKLIIDMFIAGDCLYERGS